MKEGRGPGRYSTDHSMGTGGDKAGGKISSLTPTVSSRLISFSPTEIDCGAWRPVTRSDRVGSKQAEIINGQACVPCRIFGPGR